MTVIPHVYTIRIATSLTSTPLDESLLNLETFLSKRFVDSHPHAQQQEMCCIDLAALGVGERERTLTPSLWEGASLVCGLRLYLSHLFTGPFYRPTQNRGPCPLCLERRWATIHLSEEKITGTSEQLIVNHNPLLTPFALESLETLIGHLLSREMPTTNTIYALRLDTLQSTNYQLIADPFCPICSQPTLDTAANARIHLTSRPKRTVFSYHPINAAEITLPQTGYVNPICGVLGPTLLEDHTQTIDAPVTGKFWHKSGIQINEAYWTGFGDTYAMSRTLGMLEGLERYAGLKSRGKKLSVFDTYANLAPDALNPLDCGVYPDAYYQTLSRSLTPFTPDLKIPWVWGYSFRQARPILIPAQMSYYGDHHLEHPHFVADTSSGCAIGTSLEEAIFFGLLELIERDAFFLPWYAKLAPRRIDPWSSSNRQVLFMLDRINRLGYDVHCLDARFDLPIPAIIAVAVLREQRFGALCIGARAGFDPQQTLYGALHEIGSAISRFSFMGPSRQEWAMTMIDDYRKIATVEDHGLLYGLPAMAQKASFLYQNPTLHPIDQCYEEWFTIRPQTLDLLDDLQFLIRTCLQLGLDVIVTDQTSPEQEEVGLKTARVIVPGLLPIDFGAGKIRGITLPRLRYVPQQAGYLDAPFDSANCNLLPHPFP